MANQLPAFSLHRGHPYLPDFWDYYTQLPDIYDRFALSTDAGVDMLQASFDLTRKSVLDIAAGTGRSAFAMARFAKKVVGVEPDATMREFACRRQREVGVSNVEFLAGSTDDLPPLAPRSFRLVSSFHGLPLFLHKNDEANRRGLRELVRSLSAFLLPGSAIAFVMAIPGWRHEYLQSAPPNTRYPAYDPDRRMEAALLAEGFTSTDALLEVDYGTLEEALATYGFIYGPHAIDWLLATQSSKFSWGNRIHLRVA